MWRPIALNLSEGEVLNRSGQSMGFSFLPANPLQSELNFGVILERDEEQHPVQCNATCMALPRTRGNHSVRRRRAMEDFGMTRLPGPEATGAASPPALPARDLAATLRGARQSR